MTSSPFDTPLTTEERPMRRSERALSADAALEIIRCSNCAVLSTADGAGVPYGVPVTPVLVGNTLYFHSTGRPGGRKADNMLANNKVSLCFIGKSFLIPEFYSVDFASVVVAGIVSEVREEAEKMQAMQALLKRYAPNNSDERNAVQFAHRFPLLSVWRVDIESITGKARGASLWQGAQSLKEVQALEPQEWLQGVPL